MVSDEKPLKVSSQIAQRTNSTAFGKNPNRPKNEESLFSSLTTSGKFTQQD